MTLKIDAGEWVDSTWALFLDDLKKDSITIPPESRTFAKIQKFAADFFIQKLKEAVEKGQVFDFTVCGCDTEEKFLAGMEADVSRRVTAAWDEKGPFSAYYPPSDVSSSSWCSIQ